MRARTIRRQAEREQRKLDPRAIRAQLVAGTASPEVLASMRATHEQLRQLATSGERENHVAVLVPPKAATTGNPFLDRPAAILFSEDRIAIPRLFVPLAALVAALRVEGNELMADYLQDTPLDLVPAIVFNTAEDARVVRVQPLAMTPGGQA